MNPEQIQAAYYQRTAENYDDMHIANTDFGHARALSILGAYINHYNIRSILDIGAGTGRTLLYLKEKFPHIRSVGIEPVKELREQGYKKGLSENELVGGDGYQLSFKEGDFDLVCEFGILHHVRNPQIIVAEMLRVAGTGIFISDSNNFGQGSLIARTVKQLLNFLRLWPAYNFIRTKGKMYHISKRDGLFYSYSVYNNFKQISKQCEVFASNIAPADKNLYRSASHMVLFGAKKNRKIQE